MDVNIKFLNREIKQKVENFFKKEKFYKEIIIKLMTKWKLYKIVIDNFYFDYDTIVFQFSDKNSFLYEVKFDLFSNSVTIIQMNKKFYKTYSIIDDSLEIITRGYIKDNRKLEKVYRDDNILEYNFVNNYLNSTIYIILKDNQKVDEILLIKTLLESQEEIFDISTLYTKINSIFDVEKINIINTFNGYDEKILVVSNELKEYKKCLIKENGIEYIDYQNEKIFVTREEKENIELDRMKKLIK